MANIFGYPEKVNGADFTPLVKYDARAGRFTRIDRVQDQDGNFVSEPVDITAGFKCIMDLENIETGWMHFMAGQAPQMVLVRLGEPYPDQPSQDYKPGVRILVKLEKSCGGDVREITGNSKAFMASMEHLIPLYDSQKKNNAGKLPVVVVDRVIPVKSGKGAQSSTNYHPVFKISGWAARPADLVFVPRASTASHTTPVPQPPWVDQNAPADSAASDDFG